MKSISSLLLALFCLVSIFLSSCNDRPDGVLSDSEMVDLLTDLQLAEAYNNTSASGSGNVDRRSLEEAVLKKHGVTREQLEATIAYYARNLDDYSKLYDKVEKKLRAQTGAGGSETITPADDIWPYGRFALLMPNQMSDGISFSIQADELKPGNTLEWGMRLTSVDGVDMMLGVQYEDGSASIQKKSASGNKNLQINLQTDTALNAVRIFGVLTAPKRSMPIWTDSIHLIKAEFDSTAYSKINMQRLVRKPSKKTIQPSIQENQQIPTGNPVPIKMTVDTTMRKPD